MPAPSLPSNKYNQQVENNIYLASKMRQAFVQACYALSLASSGPLENFQVTIDGIFFSYRQFDSISINENSYDGLEPKVKKQAYDRLDKFMKIAISRYNAQYNL